MTRLHAFALATAALTATVTAAGDIQGDWPACTRPQITLETGRSFPLSVGPGGTIECPDLAIPTAVLATLKEAVTWRTISNKRRARLEAARDWAVESFRPAVTSTGRLDMRLYVDGVVEASR